MEEPSQPKLSRRSLGPEINSPPRGFRWREESRRVYDEIEWAACLLISIAKRSKKVGNVWWKKLQSTI